MSDVISHGVVVRPRVVLRPEEGPRLLGDVVSELADELPAGSVWIVGGPGSGKSTAIAYLSTQFGDDPRLALADEPTREQLDGFGESQLVFATATAPRDRKGVVLRLSKWDCDDLVEYLLAVHPADCKSVMLRLGSGVRKSWVPQLACAIVQRLAADESVADAEAALTAEVANQLGNPTHLAVAAEYCFALATKDHELLQSTTYALARVGCPQSFLSLMRHEEVQHPLAAAAVMTALTTRKSLRKLLRLPRELVRIVGSRCRENAQAIQRLRGVLNSSKASTVQPMAASILSIADRAWRPEGDKDRPCFLSQGMFEGANWAQAGLAHASLRQSDLSRANLAGANLVEADATESIFASADLNGARLIGLRAARADFSGATLVNAKLALLQAAHASFAGADLRCANLVKADLAETDLTGANLAKADLFCARLIGAAFEEADFTDAKLDQAYLMKADLRRAVLAGVSFKGAYMTHVQMEDVVLPHAQLERAHLNYAQLTGSRFPAANLRGARLVFAQLAEIDWPAADLHGADLFGASFHMGSSRSGLVGSPIACEGSKTGFYTDDREEIYFKRPEEIRKANLCGADLRGARIDNVDFYLVDLRGARLTSDQEAQARRTGAILDDWETC